VNPGEAAKNSYEFIAQSAISHSINVRAEVGETLTVTVDEINTLSTHEIVAYKDNGFTTHDNANGFRYNLEIDREVVQGMGLFLNGDVLNGCLWGFQGYSTEEDMRSLTSTSIEWSGSYATVRNYTFANSEVKWVRITFKAESGNLTSEQRTAINKLYVSIIGGMPDDVADAQAYIMEKDGKKVLPMTTAKQVICQSELGDKTLDEYLDEMEKLEDEDLVYLRNAKRPQYRTSQYAPSTTPCTLLHFSDIHGDEPNTTRIVQFLNNYKQYIDDALCTGDIIKNLFSDSLAFWENAEAGGILSCVGNHEYYNGETTTPYYKQIAQKQVYDKFLAPYIEDWGVTQPEDAEENGLNYYYKDYDASKVRLIVLDNFRVDEAQLSWFEGVLADAITNNLHVVAATHIGNPIGMDTYDNPFTSLRENNPSSANGWVFEATELLYAKVDDFIVNNGVFVGWLMGHRHSDVIGVPHDHPNQLVIHVATGSCGSAWDIIPKGDNCDRTPGSKSQDCFNIYSIDTYYKMIRIHRIGCDVDRDFRHIGNLCYDYENHRVIYVD
jgi:hypothetical protein